MSEQKNYSSTIKKFWLKYIVDKVASVALLVLTSPIFLIASILIKLDGFFYRANSGPIFYTEPRVSEGREFKIIKFRTIPMSGVQKIRENPDDTSITSYPKKTYAGRIILKWYLDELPQLINIAKGEMTFVGPRPHIIGMHRKEIERGLLYRNIFRAGLLGIPQACKRDTIFASRLKEMANSHTIDDKQLNKLDALYANKCMDKNVLQIIFLDLTIIFQCLVIVAKGEKEVCDNRRN